MRFTTALVLYSVRTELHMTIKIECVSHSFWHAQKRLCQARFPQVSHTENTHTRWDCLQTRTLLGTLKTHMFSKIKFKSCALFGTHIRRTYLVRLTSRPRTRIDTQNNAHIKRDWLQHSHPIRHAQKRTCQIKLLQVSHYIQLTQKTYMSSNITWSPALYLARTKRTCQVRMTSHTMFSALRKRTCQLRLTTSLILYSTRTERLPQVWY